MGKLWHSLIPPTTFHIDNSQYFQHVLVISLFLHSLLQDHLGVDLLSVLCFFIFHTLGVKTSILSLQKKNDISAVLLSVMSIDPLMELFIAIGLISGGLSVLLLLVNITARWWQPMSLMLALRRRKQADLNEFEDSLVYRDSARTATAMLQNSVLRNQTNK